MDQLKQEGSVYTFKCGNDRSFSILSIPSIIRIIRKVNPDMIHTHSSFSGRIAGKICGKKVVYTKHCVFDVPSMYKYKLFRIIYRFVDDIFADKIIAVAEAAKNELVLKGVDQRKIIIIINGSLPLRLSSKEEKANLKSKLNISPNDLTVGIVARLEEYKGHKTFIRAAELSVKDGENIKFVIIGDGSCREELEEYARNRGVIERVIFIGFTTNVAKYMNILDLNINCSYGTETSCLAISEGASLGIPAIATDYGGNPNMIINGITGYLYPQNNANELYKIIKSLKNSPKIIDKMKKNIKNDYIERFTANKMAVKYETLYYSLI
jgi:glycosyltransferase involved in cell wall biosynthesis